MPTARSNQTEGENMLKGKKAIIVASVATLVAAGAAAAGIAIIKPYAVGIDGDYYTQRLLSVGDTVPETSDPSKQYQMIGIPDGLGAHKSRQPSGRLHEPRVTNTTLSEPVVGEPLNRGAIVSKLVLDTEGRWSPASAPTTPSTSTTRWSALRPTSANLTPALRPLLLRLACGPGAGLRSLHLPRERGVDRPATFDGKGGLAVAIFDNEAHRAAGARPLLVGEHARPAVERASRRC